MHHLRNDVSIKYFIAFVTHKKKNRKDSKNIVLGYAYSNRSNALCMYAYLPDLLCLLRDRKQKVNFVDKYPGIT